MTNFQRVFNERFEESGFAKIEDFIFCAFMHDDIILQEISEALEEKYDIEKFAEEINHNLAKYSETYPLFIRKLPKENVFGYSMHTTQCTIDFLEDKSFEYVRLNFGIEKDMLKQTEAVLKYWDDIHKFQKESKRQKVTVHLKGTNFNISYIFIRYIFYLKFN